MDCSRDAGGTLLLACSCDLLILFSYVLQDYLHACGTRSPTSSSKEEKAPKDMPMGQCDGGSSSTDSILCQVEEKLARTPTMDLDMGSCYKPTPRWVLDLALVPPGDKTETSYPYL